ncbi:MAG TPA: lysophospholipid acyltransferase family protein [Burkholderiales bacterium]
MTDPATHDGAGPRFIAWLGRSGLALAGWRVVGARPREAKYVLIAAPHTSNWDFPLMLLCGMALGVWPAWVGKASLFRAPFGALMRALRGIPIERSAAHNMVGQLAAQFPLRATLALAMPPEGTRARAPHWKSGFYFVAQTAGVPIALGYVDWARREGGIGAPITPSGDAHADMDRIRAFYAGKEGRFPALQGPVCLQSEETARSQAGETPSATSR